MATFAVHLLGSRPLGRWEWNHAMSVSCWTAPPWKDVIPWVHASLLYAREPILVDRMAS